MRLVWPDLAWVASKVQKTRLGLGRVCSIESQFQIKWSKGHGRVAWPSHMISSPSLIGSNSVCAKSESRFFKPWLQAKRKAGRWWFSRRWKRAPLTTAHMRQVQRYNCGTVDEQWHIATIVQQEANTQKTLLLYLWFSELKNWAWKPFSKNKIHPYKSTETNKPSLFCVLCTPTKRNSFEKLSLSLLPTVHRQNVNGPPLCVGQWDLTNLHMICSHTPSITNALPRL